jgi:leader peptidase (prepilin peptidase)/N-methyltransferase
MHTDLILSSTIPPGVMLAGAGVLGAIIGSFLGAALERMPAERSIVTGRSACDHCGTALAVQDLVPVISWLALKGRCRTCGGRIGAWQLACELGGAAIGMASVALAPEGLALAAMALGWQLLLLALLDLRHLWLPRVLTGVLALNGALLAAARGWAMQDIWPLEWALIGGALAFGMLWSVAFAYRRLRGRDGMGGGDPPLMGAIGLWLGPLGVVHTLLGAALVGLIAAVAMHVSGRKIGADTALPLGTCLAATAWPLFLIGGFG